MALSAFYAMLSLKTFTFTLAHSHWRATGCARGAGIAGELTMKRVLLGVALGMMAGAAAAAPAPHLAIAAMADLPVVERQPYNESADA